MSKPTSTAMAAAVLAVNLLASAKDWLSFFLSNHKETPASTMQAEEFGANRLRGSLGEEGCDVKHPPSDARQPNRHRRHRGDGGVKY